jgi:dephospho-CoA kinase
MLKVGITGGIGSGKTTVCKIFELLGIPVFYADQAAKELMQHDEGLKLKLRKKFGTDTYHPDGSINRTYLANIVFKDEAQLEALNAIVHPAVFSAFDQWLSKQSAKYVVKEAALLFESGSHQLCDFNVLVQAPEEIRIERVMKRDQITKEQVMGRIAQQMSDEEKSKLADHLLMNDEKELLIPQIMNLHQKLLAGDLPQ